MAKRKGKNQVIDALDTIVVIAETVDTVFERLAGKPLSIWLREFQQQPKELPPGEQAGPQEPAMPLADAYAVLGLPQTASLEEIKRNYKSLAFLFHPDKGGYNEAMVLLNRAYDRISREGKTK